MTAIHQALKRYILADGLPHVIDWNNSQGSWFVDATTGQRYLDCYSMHAAQPLGWNHPSFHLRSSALHSYVGVKPANSDFYSREYAGFVERFAKVTPDHQTFFFIDTGTLAVENALKAAFDWKAQKLGWHDEHEGILDVIHLEEAFHGRSGYTLSLTNTGITKTKWFPQFKWTRIINPKLTDDELAEAVSLRQAEQALQTGQVAAIILEPIQGEGGDNHFGKSYLEGLRRLADQYEALFILDEVQTGLGMTGRTWCHQHFDVVPDILVFGKKTQVCGIASNSRIQEVPSNVFTTSGRVNSTWGGNLMDMMRCHIILDIIEEEALVQNAAKVGDYLLNKMKELPLKNVRGRGLMIAFDLPTTEERNEFHGKLSEKVLCLKCGPKSIRFRPHLTFSEESADYLVDALKGAI